MTGPVVRRALLQFPVNGERRWLSFDAPRHTIVADEMRDVPAAMEAAERAATDGRWVVGMVSYDAGPAFDDAIRAARPIAAILYAESAIRWIGAIQGWSAVEVSDAVWRVRFWHSHNPIDVGWIISRIRQAERGQA